MSGGWRLESIRSRSFNVSRSILPVTLFFVVVGLVQAAPVPKAKLKDYQKLADETGWQFAEQKSVESQVADELKGYKASVIQEASGEGYLSIQVSEDGKAAASVTVHQQSALRQRDGILYYADFHPHSSGCAVVAFDLKAKKQLWKADLKGLGGIDHSKYFNAVRMEVLDDDTLRVFGKESAGRYVEIVDRGTGKTVGHKVFDEKK